MPTPITINSIVEKLLNQPNKISELKFGSVLAKRKLAQLKERINALYIDETSFQVLSTLLQNISLEIFTDEELITLLKFDYSFIENKTIVGTTSYQNLNKPYYDLNGTIINVEDTTRLIIDEDFQLLHAMASTLSIEFLISYILNQV